ncbi:MAG: hypothetical protein EON47_10820, partial [Acetobacteraceae bacterium]
MAPEFGGDLRADRRRLKSARGGFLPLGMGSGGGTGPGRPRSGTGPGCGGGGNAAGWVHVRD